MTPSELNLTVDQRSAVPLYEQICQALRNKIETRQLTPGTRLPTSHQLRAHLEVSYKTAHQAMAKLADEGFVTRKARSGTVVKGIPRRGVVGIYVWSELLDQDPKREFYRLIAHQLSQQLQELGRVYRLYLGGESLGDMNTAEEDLLRHLSGGALCGAIVVNPFSRRDELMKLSHTQRIPVVSLTRRRDMDYSVLYDNLDYMRQAADHLKRHGCKRVGVVYNGTNDDLAQQHINIGRVLADRGCPTREAWIAKRDRHAPGDYEQAGYKAAAGLPLPELDGLIINDDNMALGVARRLDELGIHPPHPLRVATACSRGSRLELPASFARFELDVAGLARSALNMLQDIITGQRIGQPHQTFGPTPCNTETPVPSQIATTTD